MAEKEREPACLSFKGTDPVVRAPPSDPNYLPEAPPPHINTLEISGSTHEFVGTKYAVIAPCIRSGTFRTPDKGLLSTHSRHTPRHTSTHARTHAEVRPRRSCTAVGVTQGQ